MQAKVRGRSYELGMSSSGEHAQVHQRSPDPVEEALPINNHVNDSMDFEELEDVSPDKDSIRDLVEPEMAPAEDTTMEDAKPSVSPITPPPNNSSASLVQPKEQASSSPLSDPPSSPGEEIQKRQRHHVGTLAHKKTLRNHSKPPTNVSNPARHSIYQLLPHQPDTTPTPFHQTPLRW